MQLFDKIPNPRLLRHQLGLNQEAFWGSVGVTQSGGSRYESGRDMPKAVRELVRLVHVEGLDLSRIRNDDFAIVEYLQQAHPDLYKHLHGAVQAARAARQISPLDTPESGTSRQR
ncbi:helix-turn-helix domain-containing protein [Microvirgula aerodenitrificans]|uniref:helix-turn-helix domain-containing protein n=1 Tax=Microvirgula aerodenitrificans TaxID=57480 RepID=UPI00048DB796|nr:helix-turn-helix transcriptional regulator [Microvirgula aerodenitrificans]